jgi:hypothetical protein
MAANANKVYLAAVGPNAGPQFVIAFDPSTSQETARATVEAATAKAPRRRSGVAVKPTTFKKYFCQGGRRAKR